MQAARRKRNDFKGPRRGAHVAAAGRAGDTCRARAAMRNRERLWANTAGHMMFAVSVGERGVW